MNKLKRSIAAGALVLATALTGCANDPTTLATVNGHVIKASAIDPAVTALREHAPRGFEQRNAVPIVTQLTVLGEVVEELYQRTEVKYDAKAVDAALAQTRETATGDDRAFATDARLTPMLRTSIALKMLEQQADPVRLGDALRAMDVRLNPRFGSWDPVRGLQSSSLSRLAEGEKTES